MCVCIGSGYHDIVTGHLKSTNHFIQEKMRAIRNIYRQILQLYHVCVSPVAFKRCVKNHKRRTPRIRRETSVRAHLFTPPTLVLLPSRSLLSSDSTECECSERHERTDAFRAGGGVVAGNWRGGQVVVVTVGGRIGCGIPNRAGGIVSGIVSVP